MEIYYSGRSQCKPKHSSGPAMRDHYILHYVSSGRGVYTSGGNSYSILPGQGFLTLPGIINYHIADASDPWFYTWVAFKGDNVPEILKGLQFDGDALVFEVIKENQVFFELILDKIITSSDSDFKTYLLHTGNIYNLLSSINILSSLDPEIDTMYKRYKKYNNDEYINKALDYIYKNYCRDVHIKDIAQHVSLDHKYLCMLFHK
ncbi:MAG TPA: hypothetical protein DCY35_04415, partial [Prolixibacteraceae bacterium]|nr:hypothetical protein [Prolixibacteraceae bacterium]